MKSRYIKSFVAITMISIVVIPMNILFNCSSPVGSDQKNTNSEHIFDCGIPAKTDLVNGRVVEIFNRTGKCVAYMQNEYTNIVILPEFENRIIWDGKDLDSNKVPPGMYYAKLTKIKNGQATTLCLEVPVDGSKSAPAQAPGNVKVTPGKNSFAVQWNHCDSALGYTVIYWTKNGSKYDSIARVNYDSIDTVKDLITGTIYTIEVLAFNSNGSSPPSEPITITIPDSPPIPPEDLRVESGNRRAIISWDASYDSDSFVVYCKKIIDSGIGIASERRFTVKGFSDTIDGLENGSTYSISVAGKNKWGVSEPSFPASAVPVLDEVHNIKLNRISSDTFEITWDTVLYASHYIAVIFTTGKTVTEQKVTSNHFRFKASATYNGNTYCVKACDEPYTSGCHIGGTITFEVLPPPENVRIIHFDQQIAVTWDRLNSHKEMGVHFGVPEILYCQGKTFDFSTAKKLQEIKSVPVDTHSISAGVLTNVKNGDWYTFRVRESNSINGDSSLTTFYSPWSSPVSGIAMPRPPYLVLTMARGQVYTMHDLIENAEYYTIYYAPGTASSEKAQKQVSYSRLDTIKGLDPDSEYEFMLNYSYAGVQSDYTLPVKMKPIFDLVVDSFKVTISNDSAIVSWKSVNSNLDYDICLEKETGDKDCFSYGFSPLVLTGLKQLRVKRIYLSVCAGYNCDDRTYYFDIENP